MIRAALAYLVLAVAATWPLTPGIARDVAWDLGDSLLNMWILAWDCEQILAILGGDLSRIRTFFDANIFHPAPLTLAYSEHLFPQALQVLPIYVVSGNPILCYNLLFLSTIVLSGLGTFVFVRALTGNAWAAFVAGILFAFAPYRIGQATHVQVLSAQWMPFVLYGIHRYFESRRLRPLLWAAVALVVQNLSCGYYLLFFAPFAAAYAVWEAWARGAARQRVVWAHLLTAGMVVAALTGPFLLPYLDVHQRFGTIRTRTEVVRLSADVYSYATAFPEQPLWGDVVQAFPKPEGELFPGFAALFLALVGVFFRLKPQATDIKQGGVPLQALPWRRHATSLLLVLGVLHVVLALTTMLERRVVADLGVFTLRMSDVNQLLLRAGVAFALALAVSSGARARFLAYLRARGFFVAALVIAAWLSLGPTPQSYGRPLDLIGPYGWLYDYVPGFSGLRVPARFGMIVALMLAVLGGLGAAQLARRRAGRWATAALAAMFLLEGTRVPFVVNGMTPPVGYVAPAPRLMRPARAPRLYHAIATLPDTAVLAELPLGQPDFDLRAVYYSTVHWRKIVNGYSGFSPPHYGTLAAALGGIPRRPDTAMDALAALGATHVLVHEGAYLGNEGVETSDVLRRRGAVELDREGSDVLLELRP